MSETSLEPQFKTPTTVEEIGVHMFYLRNAVQRVDKKIDEISNGFVTREEFVEHLKADADHETRIRVVESFKETLVGKIWGVGIMAGAIVGVITIIINHFWK